ncbi:hypothetical protein CEP53_008785 [Fusarium sp. AF-6]|nr:hypothetical protein CEP53_008785 [Fusarium sp. AF-6]
MSCPKLFGLYCKGNSDKPAFVVTRIQRIKFWGGEGLGMENDRELGQGFETMGGTC